MDEKIFSLITTTRYRTDEVSRYLQSVLEAEFPLDRVEIIICDQNQANEAQLDLIIKNFSNRLEINHLRVAPLGTGFSRGEGIKVARGKYLAFPDDDCIYYSDTLKMAASYLDTNPSLYMVLGKVFDRASKKNLLKNWPDDSKVINRFNFYKLYTCISIFARKTDINFDPSFGVGAKYGSAEDADFVFQYLKNRLGVEYHPHIHVWHPDEVLAQFSIEKVKQYSYGFGAFCRKNICLPIGIIFCAGLLLQFLRFFKFVLTGSVEDTRKSLTGLIYRVKGFF